MTRSPRFTLHWSTWLFGGTIVLGLVIRLFSLSSPLHLIDDDQAIVYLMAKRVSLGEWPAYYWGQSYGGTLLPLTTGVVFLFTGPSIVVLSVVGLAFWLFAAFLVRQIGIAVWDVRVGNLAAVFFWLPGAIILRLSTLDPGFYGPALVLSLSAILLVVGTEGRLSSLRMGLLGLVAGLSLWTSPTALAAALVAIIWSLARGTNPARFFFGLGGALLGSAPFWIYNFTNNFAAIRMYFSPDAPPLSILYRLWGLVGTVVPSALSVDPQDLVGAWWWRWWPSAQDAPRMQAEQEIWLRIVLAVLISAIVVICIVRASAQKNRRAWVLFSAAFATVLALGASMSGVTMAESRYAAFVLPFVALCAADLVARKAWTLIAGVVVAAAMTIVPTIWAATMLPREDAPFGPGVDSVIEFLDARSIDSVYADYWIANRLTAATDEGIVAASLNPRRFPPYEEIVGARKPTVFVVYKDFDNEKIYLSVPPMAGAERYEVGGYVIIISSDLVDPFQWPPAIL